MPRADWQVQSQNSPAARADRHLHLQQNTCRNRGKMAEVLAAKNGISLQGGLSVTGARLSLESQVSADSP